MSILQNPFKHSPEVADPFVVAQQTAQSQRLHHNQNREATSLEKLSLSDDGRDRYAELANRPGELIVWMGTQATAAYKAYEEGTASRYLVKDPAKIALEIHGLFQESWQHTKQHDDFARQIPREVEAADSRVGMQVYYGNRDVRTRQRLMPLWSNGDFRYAVLRRKLIMAHAIRQEQLPVEIHKDSSVVVDTVQLADLMKSRGQDLEVHDVFMRDRDAASKTNSRLAKRAGALFSAAIQGDEELQQTMLPVGSRHVMAVRLPGSDTLGLFM